MKTDSGWSLKAMTNLRLLGYFAMLATEQNCILPKQFERIPFFATDCMNFLGAWMNRVCDAWWFRWLGNNVDNDNVRLAFCPSAGNRFARAKVCAENKGIVFLLEVISFELNLFANPMELSRHLEQKTYRISEYVSLVMIPKSMEIHALRNMDMVVQYCIFDEVLATLMESHLIYDNTSCRKDNRL